MQPKALEIITYILYKFQLKDTVWRLSNQFQCMLVKKHILHTIYRIMQEYN